MPGATLISSIRFIPAPAENTCMQTNQRPVMPVHPRTCGEHIDGDTIRTLLTRFIPAPAGNTRIARVDRSHVRLGSSPHLRGTPADD